MLLTKNPKILSLQKVFTMFNYYYLKKTVTNFHSLEQSKNAVVIPSASAKIH